MARTPLEFFFDYGSPYSYLASTQIEDVCAPRGARGGVTLVWRPMLLGAVFKATGNQSPAFEKVESKRRYGAVVMQRVVAQLGVPFAFNPHFPINTLPIMRACVAAQREGVFEAFHRAVFPAFWVGGLDLGEPAVFADVLAKAGLDAARLVARAGEADVKDELRATTDEAVARGAFGAPTMFLGDEMFFGVDSLPFLERALAKA